MTTRHMASNDVSTASVLGRRRLSESRHLRVHHCRIPARKPASGYRRRPERVHRRGRAGRQCDRLRRRSLGPVSLGGAPAEGDLSTWHLGFFQKDFAQDLVRGHERDLVKGFVEQYLAVDGAFDDRDYEFYARYLREPGRFKAWMNMYQALHTDIAQNEKFREAGLLQMPILAVGGEEALSTAVGIQWQGYAANVETQVMADTGHWLTEERPQELTRMLLTFLR
ncbi:alpha/beta fold hydrolase [Micromonospora tulbaghiae]|uniref:alpha/beta fold hydrolase n=1 Tax=Micromonospora tulbaghiae TaxID=479978 RepID=UPI0033FD498A